MDKAMRRYQNKEVGGKELACLEVESHLGNSRVDIEDYPTLEEYSHQRNGHQKSEEEPKMLLKKSGKGPKNINPRLWGRKGGDMLEAAEKELQLTNHRQENERVPKKGTKVRAKNGLNGHHTPQGRFGLTPSDLITMQRGLKQFFETYIKTILSKMQSVTNHKLEEIE